MHEACELDIGTAADSIPSPIQSGLAMAESERYLPVLIDKLEKVCEDAGLRNDSIVMRMTGCPNVSLATNVHDSSRAGD